VAARERRVGGGGGGAAPRACDDVVLSAMLPAYDSSPACDALDAAVLLRGRAAALAVRIWLLRRASGGAGGTFFGDVSGSEYDCDGGDGSGSGALVEDFRSKGVGLGSSDDVRGGGGGSGLFKSVGVRLRLLVEDGLVTVMGKVDVLSDPNVGEKSSNDTVCGPLGATTLPCRCLGGGGFFFSGLLPSAIKVARSSSSDTESSYEVRGVSPCGSCRVSNSDCRESEDVSVLLLLSPWRFVNTFDCMIAGAPEGVALPVISKFLNESTSMAGFDVGRPACESAALE